METTSPAGRLVGRDRGFSDTFAARPRMFNERDPMRHGSSPAGRESRPPSSVPKGLESMLKTTTETGDIGMFSIKPSRVPQSPNTPRRMGNGFNELRMPKTRQPFQPYGVPMVDDRRRLPSYARDNSSDVHSMYETSSQKSARSASRAFDDPDYRSYSMTQTSYTSYTLSNHRSYASLRSQPDGNGIVQRPRSPFAYPTRLKRPGFRPSSPALTDGGAVDYSRRVEIDRAPYGPGQNTASPSSLYAQRRKPPLSLRAEGNRSTPSLLSQPSPPRRSSSPLVPRQNGFSGNDWQRRNVTISGNTSPARSTLSRASTVNLHATAPVHSVTTAPGKLHPPSPLYYDYTEDFEVEVCTQSEAFGPPPQFRVGKTIPEDRPMSADGPRLDEAPNGLRSGGCGFQTMASTFAEQPKPREAESQPANVDNFDLPQQEPGLLLPTVEEAAGKRTISNGSAAGERKKVIRLSGLGYGARELSCHVEEAFGLPSSSSFVIDVNKAEKETQDPETEHMISTTEDNPEPNDEPQSTRASSYSLGSQFPQFPCPPGGLEETQSNGTKNTHGEQAKDQVKAHAAKQDARRSLSDPSDNSPSKKISKASQCLPPSGRPRARSSGFASIDTGLSDLAELIAGANKSQSGAVKAQLSIPPGRTPMTSPTIPDKSVLRILPAEDQRVPLLPSFNQQRGRELQIMTQRQPLKRNNSRVRRVEPPVAAVPDGRGIPNFSHQIPHKVIARSESPMLAPKPISPARQLKLKNSIPQLMKALPPVPPEPSHLTTPPQHAEPRVEELSSQFSPRVSNLQSRLLMETLKAKSSEKSLSSEAKLPPLPEDHAETPRGSDSAGKEKMNSTTDGKSAKASARKLKLKVKSSVPPRPLSPLGLQPWNLEESYPWINQTPNVRLPSMPPSDKPSSTRQPKFKIRVTRASDSTQGTIHVTQDTENTGTGLDLQNPADLFTPSPGIDNIFRQFGRHLHSRKASAKDPEPTLAPNNASSYLNESQSAGLSALRGPASSFGVFEARSVFSDDSSHVEGHHSLRKRITNLRARIAAPYTAKTGAQSYDDITWKDRHGVEVLLPLTNQSDSNLHDIRGIPAVKPKRRFLEKLHRQKLKAKVRGWLKGARLAFTTRVKSRRSRGVSGSGSVDVDKFK
ncbi:uncharacterized protein PAC_00480 [Phialocephala subalpina]|uniref:Uncharacterized protein n=1 Tax=Phialocephala subalpina TaxID=576137 RepID=A0A1L7WCW0_9HELO|nr:uncharacterized protein PAC_00480 [Phialocephala subalpina]